MSFEASIRGDSDNEVKGLFKSAKKRKEEILKYRLLSEMLDGKLVTITNNTELFEALNKEKMDFETLLNNHPKEVADCIEYVKERKAEQAGRWYNPNSQAWWGEKGAIPPCCYFARPSAYWKDKRLMNNFLNQFSKFRIAEKPL